MYLERIFPKQSETRVYTLVTAIALFLHSMMMKTYKSMAALEETRSFS
jgi:hypothetical protein